MLFTTTSDLIIPQNLGVIVHVVMSVAALVLSVPILATDGMRSLLRVERGWVTAIGLYTAYILVTVNIHTYIFGLGLSILSSGNMAVIVSGVTVSVVLWVLIIYVAPRLGHDWEGREKSGIRLQVGVCILWYTILASLVLYLGKSGILNRILSSILT